MQSMMRMLAGLAASATLGLAGCQTVSNVTDRPPAPSVSSMQTPIIFVHGNGDTAALWHTTIWRFESNGYPRDRLHAIDFINPQARSEDAKPQEGRSGTGDQLRDLSAFVDQVRKITGMGKVALVASSRGANAVRNFIRNGGGAAVVSHAVLAGGVNHGVYASATFNPGSEFNGAGPFMTALNAPYPDGSEVTPGVKWMTLRSDNFDKYAQPDGRFVGQPGMKTNVTFEGPALRGAENVVLPRADHREVAFGPAAFAEMFRFITGARPARTDIVPEDPVVLNGKVSGYLNGAPTNLPLVGAKGHGLSGRRGNRRAHAGRAASKAGRPRRLVGAAHGARQSHAGIHHRSGGISDHPHLPLAVSTLFGRRSLASGAAGQRGQR